MTRPPASPPTLSVPAVPAPVSSAAAPSGADWPMAATSPVPGAATNTSETPPDPNPPAPQLSADAARRIAGYSSAGHPLLRERLAATHAALESESDAHFSVELFLTDNSDPARTERFLQRAGDLVDLSELYVIPIGAGNRYRLRIAYGVFPDRAAAEEAARRLPPKYRQAFQPQPRDFKELRGGL